MIIVTEKITLQEINELAKQRFGNIIKGVVDIKKEILALDAELHADQEKALLSR